MTQQFHAGQDVEVGEWRDAFSTPWRWRKAKILGDPRANAWTSPNSIWVQFSDGSRGVFDAAHIRVRFPLDNYQMRFGSSPVVLP
jgi:hypothetical protein